jgi:hypothetical protein
LRRLGKLEFESGTLAVTEAGTKRRASLHLVEGADALRFCGCMTRRTVRCRTGSQGFVLLADRSLSRLLKKSWPRSIDELE